MVHTWKCRLAACVLLFCLGLTVPAVGAPIHLCLTSLLAPETTQEDCCGMSQSCCEKTDSCCDSKAPLKLPCCVELENLPDAQTPPSPQPAPEAPVSDLGWASSLPSLDAQVGVDVSINRPERIRGPCSPSQHRALLEIWRL